MKSTFAIFCFLFIVACGGPKINTVAEGEKLMQVSRDWSNAAASGNIDSILSYWAEEAMVMEPGYPALKGKKEIRSMVEESSKAPGFKISWEPISATVSKSGDMGYLIERTQVTVNDSLGNPHTQYNKAVTIWQKDAEGNWKNMVDIWNEEKQQ